jgi:hypothetical protein
MTDSSTDSKLGELKRRYNKYLTARLPYETRARECALLTIPALIPPLNATSSTRFPTPYQSLGARGVNNLSSKLLLTLLPPNSPFFKLEVDDFMLQKMTGKEGMRAQVEEALSSMERSFMTEVETTGIRPGVFEGLKHLLVSGNCLLYLAPNGGIKVFPLTRYVCKRDPMGNLLEVITKENISELELPASVRALLAKEEKEDSDLNLEDSEELYTCVKLSQEGIWEVWQEVEGITIPDSYGTYPKDKNPWLALRFIAISGEDYGRGYVEEYLGDHKSLEGLTKSIVQGSAASAKVLFLLKPAASTKAASVAKAESGDIITGNPDDISTLQVQKHADFTVAANTIKDLKDSLSYAYLLNSSVQRSGERVTAEEIRYMANELETALGGIYSTLSQEFQLPLVRVIMARMEAEGKLPSLPPGTVKPMITTGVEAIGRGQDLTKLSGLLQDIQVLGPQTISQYLNIGDYIKRCGVGRGIDMKGLVRTEEEIAQQQEQAQQQNMMQTLGPNAVNQLGNITKQSMSQQQEDPSQQPQ